MTKIIKKINSITMLIAGIVLVCMSTIPAYGASVETEAPTDVGHVAESGSVNTDLRLVAVDEDQSNVYFSLMIDNSMSQTAPICNVKIQLPSDDVHNHGFGLNVIGEPTWRGDTPSIASINYSSKEIDIHIENLNAGERYFMDISTILTDGRELPTEDILEMNLGLSIDIINPLDEAWNSSSYDMIPVSMGYEIPVIAETEVETTPAETIEATPSEPAKELKIGTQNDGHYDSNQEDGKTNIYHLEINNVSVGDARSAVFFSGSPKDNKRKIFTILATAILISILSAIITYYVRRYIKEHKRKFIRSEKLERP